MVLAFTAATFAAEPDPALVARLSRFREAARQSGPGLWPGWNPAATPVALWSKDGVLLAGHPAPPKTFRRVVSAQSAEAIFFSESAEGVARANTAAVFAGTLTSFISAQDFMAKPEPEAIALGLHELFHAHFQKIAPGKQGNILVLLWGEYPELDARNRALLAAEAQTLAAAASAAAPEDARRSAAAFLALRRDRRKKLAADLHRYESGEESNEGLARYIEWSYLRKHSAGAAEARLKMLQDIFAAPGAREPFYAVGMAEAALLDRLRSDWKQQFESTPLLLDELLGDAVKPAGDTADILKDLNFASLLGQQERAVAQRLEEGSRRLIALMGSGGDRVVVEIAAVKNQLSLRGFNPNATLALTPDQVAHPFLLLDLGTSGGTKMKFEFRLEPILYDRAQDVLWFVMPAEALNQAVTTFMDAATPRPLVLKGRNFSAEFTGIELDRRPKELRIRPSRDLKRAPELKPPEFVRP